MVDRTLRDRLADAIQALIAGCITNYEFEEGLLKDGIPLLADPSRWPDPVIGPIREVAWLFLYDDTREYRLAGRDKLSLADRREVLRWVLFLRSELEYEWPRFRFTQLNHLSPSGCLLSLLTLGISSRRQHRQDFATWQQAGEYDVWPFFRRSDYDAVYRQHCPLAGLPMGAAV